MKTLYERLPSLHKRFSFCATIGVFDGVHRGHAWIIRKIIAQARKRPLFRPLVITFFPAPEYCLKKAEHFHLNGLSEKVRALLSAGRVNILVLKFDRKLAALSGVTFFKALLTKINLNALFVGDDFKFGKDRRHGMEALQLLLKKHCARLVMVKKKKAGPGVISSSRIRELLSEGRVEEARLLLGRSYSLGGSVVKGKGIGSLIGFPTANVAVSHYKLIPKSGVYAVEVVMRNRTYRGACNIGNASGLLSSDVPPALVEVHIFHFRRDLRGKRIEIYFLKRIRDEQEFPSFHDLHAQIEKDILACKRIFR